MFAELEPDVKYYGDGVVDDYEDESGCEDESENVGHVHDGSDDAAVNIKKQEMYCSLSLSYWTHCNYICTCISGVKMTHL